MLESGYHPPMNRPVWAIVLLLLVTLALSMAGCLAGGSSSSPTVSITAPEQDAVVPGSNGVAVSVNVQHFDLVNSTWETNTNGQGHLLYYLDATVPTEPGQPAMTSTGTSDPTINTTYVWTDVPPGNHTFAVQLVNNDNTPLGPLVYDQVDVFVAGSLEAPPSPTPAPSVTPLPYMVLTPTVTPTPTPPTEPVGANVTVDIMANEFRFNRSFIVVPPCANVTIHFTNNDGGMPHTVSVYYTSQAKSFFANSSNVIFDAPELVGPGVTDYHFTAPCTPGTYWFQCDVHPDVMNGQFIVASPANQTGAGAATRARNENAGGP
jgi:plastocyanin